MKLSASFTPSFTEEKDFWNKGFTHVMGIDEVGRGCFAGPVVVAGVVFHPESNFEWLLQIHDSKLLSQKLREFLAPLIRNNSLHFSIATIDVSIINTIGIGKATFLGMQQIVDDLLKRVEKTTVAVLVDAFTIPKIEVIQKPIIKGDQKSISIAAASIIAKVYRDDLMCTLGKEYEIYDLAKNKGYGTRDHRDAIKKYGLCELHRSSFDLSKYL